MRTFTAWIAVAIWASGAWAQTEECPFGPGSCPVTLDNVVDVYFHDIADYNSCQRECKLIDECNFFTMFGVEDEPTDHRKCFLFKSCDTLEDCDHPGCITGNNFKELWDSQDGLWKNVPGRCRLILQRIYTILWISRCTSIYPHIRPWMKTIIEWKHSVLHAWCNRCCFVIR